MLRLIVVLLAILTTSMGYSKMPDCEKKLNEILKEYTRLAKQQGLIAAGTGGGIKDSKISEVAVTFDCDCILYLETARQAIVNAALLLHQVIDKNPTYQDCFITGQSAENYINIAILSQSPSDPYIDYISAVSLRRGKICYNKVDPEGKINPYIRVHQESFQEAVTIVGQSLP